MSFQARSRVNFFPSPHRRPGDTVPADDDAAGGRSRRGKWPMRTLGLVGVVAAVGSLGAKTDGDGGLPQ
jgi:hypothetical protein